MNPYINIYIYLGLGYLFQLFNFEIFFNVSAELLSDHLTEHEKIPDVARMV